GAGGSLVVNDIEADAANDVVDEIRAAGGAAVPHVGAIGPTGVAEEGVARAVEAFGRLDVMACNAGILRDRTLWNTSDEDFDAVGPMGGAEVGWAGAVAALGRLEVMASNAGIRRARTLWNTSDGDFDAVVETHLRGTFTCSRAAARYFRQAGQGGRLILVSSI